MKDFVFVSGNADKVKMLEHFLGQKVDHHALDLPELQTLNAQEVVEAKAKAAYEVLKSPVLVDDVSWRVHSMGGLPGTLVKYFLEAVGPDGICRMVDGFGDRSTTAATIFVYYDGKKLHTFIGEVEGEISTSSKGDTSLLPGMGWNSIFIPKGQSETLAEMGPGKFEQFTPRARAVEKLKVFLES